MTNVLVTKTGKMLVSIFSKLLHCVGESHKQAHLQTRTQTQLSALRSGLR